MALTRVVARHLLPRTGIAGRSIFRSISSSSTDSDSAAPLLPHHRVHLLFGANTDVGKSIVSTGLVRAAAAAAASSSQPHDSSVNYIKPLQCGGSDESFVLRHRNEDGGTTKGSDDGTSDINCQTLFCWETPASPHLASRWENLPVSDNEVLSSLQSTLKRIEENARLSQSGSDTRNITTIIESAGGVLSPSSSSPLNKSTTGSYWGWSTQADLYAQLNIPVVFVGDGKLGGISVTLASLEALWSRGYRVDAVVFIEGADGDDAGDASSIQFGKGNTEALREYVTMQQLHNQEVPSTQLNSVKRKAPMIDKDAIICLPSLPPMPVPLDEWYDNNQDAFLNLHNLLCQQWRRDFIKKNDRIM